MALPWHSPSLSFSPWLFFLSLPMPLFFSTLQIFSPSAHSLYFLSACLYLYPSPSLFLSSILSLSNLPSLPLRVLLCICSCSFDVLNNTRDTFPVEFWGIQAETAHHSTSMSLGPPGNGEDVTETSCGDMGQCSIKTVYQEVQTQHWRGSMHIVNPTHRKWPLSLLFDKLLRCSIVWVTTLWLGTNYRIHGMCM